MASTRLPGKVLKKVDRYPLLEYMVKRVEMSSYVDEVVIATSTEKRDKQIVELCNKKNIKCYKGSENDVLSRYYDCASMYNADTIVRLTADCPLIDPKVIDEVITLFEENAVDFASNTTPPKTNTYPGGSDVEVFSYDALSRIKKECSNLFDREHITFCFFNKHSNYNTVQLLHDEDLSGYRYTVDHPEDFEVVKYLIKELKKQKRFGFLNEIINLIDSNENIKSLNAKWVGLEKKWF